MKRIVYIIFGIGLGVLLILNIYNFKLKNTTTESSLGMNGGRLNIPEVTIFTTTTNANFSGIPVSNINDFQFVGFTVLGDASSGTIRFACSMQDTEPTIGAATSTSNRWDYVDVVDTQTETSIDGWTGLVMNGLSGSRQFSLRNSVFKWCTALQSGNTTPAGFGTTTVYLKRVNNQ